MIDGNISPFLLELTPAFGGNILEKADSPDVPDCFHDGSFVIDPCLPFLQSNEHRITIVDHLSEEISRRRILQIDLRGIGVLTRVLAQIKADFEGQFSYSLIRTSNDREFLDVY
ncbi:MAG TPA: hypothetical protein ENN47_09765 [Mesotoga infera]|uniref:Uncharacterized protein n=1 Tax=Mesotoga infera TaxID=1236046 RepID=A0A7C1CX57_9BACT|nr:hypothetical protein [Mesotoga infera]